MDEIIITKGENWTEYFSYCVYNKVVYDNGERDVLRFNVIAKGKYEAMAIVKEFLLSREDFLVKEVVGQGLDSSTTVFIENGVIIK